VIGKRAIKADVIVWIDRRDQQKRLDHSARRDHAPAALPFGLMVRSG
jgi:hypothetical protein